MRQDGRGNLLGMSWQAQCLQTAEMWEGGNALQFCDLFCLVRKWFWKSGKFIWTWFGISEDKSLLLTAWVVLISMLPLAFHCWCTENTSLEETSSPFLYLRPWLFLNFWLGVILDWFFGGTKILSVKFGLRPLKQYSQTTTGYNSHLVLLFSCQQPAFGHIAKWRAEVFSISWDSATGWWIESAQSIPSWLYKNCCQTFSSPSIIFWTIQAPQIPQRDRQISVRNIGVRVESVDLTELLLWVLWAAGVYSMQDFPGRWEKATFCFSDRKVLVKRKIFNPTKTYMNLKN